jgi:multiple sugar transport system substrate-binding protein
VAQDFTSGNSIYAMPLDLDTIAMYYNKNLFDSAGIIYPPKTWDDFDNDIQKLRVVNSQGQITQSAAAIGGSETSIANAPDLVFLLMMQNGARMTSGYSTNATFDEGSLGGNNPGLNAFNFYLQFANPVSPYYTWNDGMGDAVQDFVSGKTAILFDYASARSEIQAKSPYLNYAIAAMPQPASATVEVNYPKYEGLAVSRHGQISAAWALILYLTTNANGERIYLNDTGEPPADRAYIAAEMSDPVYGIFASQALTARSWYEANDNEIDSIMNQAIQNVLNGSTNSERALGTAQSQINGQ